MKSKMKKLDGTARQFEIEVSQQIVEETFQRILEDFRKSANIPGFRKGKAPLDLVHKNYAKEVENELTKELVPRGYQYALDEHGLRPVSFPEITDVEKTAEGALKFKATVDAHPEIDLKKYKGLKITSEKISVEDKEVEDAVKSMRNIHAEFVDVDRPLKKGDFGLCDVETESDGQIIAKKREDMWIEVDKEASLLGMGEKLEGLKKGDKKDIEVTLPESYPDKKYAGRKAVFKVEVKSVKEKKLPEVNDEFAKKLGRENIEDMNQEIRTQLLARKESNSKMAMKDQIIKQLLKSHSFNIPGSMVERQLKVLMDNAENNLLKKGVTKDAIDEKKEDLVKQLMPEAENKVKAYFILDEIAERENIDVSEENIEEWMVALASTYNQPVENVKKYYEEHDLIGGVREQLREEKTLDFILTEAVITEKKAKK